jgi:NTE family protein
MRPFRMFRVLGCAVLVTGCASVISNEPINKPLAAIPKENVQPVSGNHSPYADTAVALAFSGGGMRAAAFSFGVLSSFSESKIKTRHGEISLGDRIDFVSGVSGGSVLAAYYGLKKQAALKDFKQRFLLQNAEASLQTDLGLVNLARGLEGGINDSTRFPRWLDANLFNGATFRDMSKTRPKVWINASDIYNRTPFVFGSATFGALCSDFSSYPVSMAVAASAAVPVVFAPVVIENYHGHCPVHLPKFIDRVRKDPEAPPLIKSYSDALERYHTGQVHYVKLLDGGLVDNYGLAGLTIARLASTTPYGPMTPPEAVKMRRLLFLVVDAGLAPSGDWSKTVAGPSGIALIMAASDTATGAGAIQSYSTFDDTMEGWRKSLIRWRCRLSDSDRRRYGAAPGWNCHDVKFFIGRIAFDQLGPERAAQLNAIETRFVLPPAQVDALIEAGRDALHTNRTFNAFLDSMKFAQPGPAVANLAPEQSQNQ